MATIHTTAAREQWATYREDALGRGETILDLPQVSRWYPYFEGGGPEKENKTLRKIWLEDRWGASSNFNDWSDLEHKTGWRGMLVPSSAPDEVGLHRLKELAERTEFYRNYFGFYPFLRATEQSVTTHAGVPVALSAAWNYVLNYARLLQRARTQGAEVGLLLRSFAAEDRFRDLLPSGQCLRLLLQYAHRNFTRLWDGPEHHRLRAAAHPSVRAFFDTAGDIGEALAGRNVAAETAFYACCRADIPFVAVQDILDDASGRNLLGKLPRTLRDRFERPASSGIKDRLQRFVGRLSILDRVRDPGSQPTGDDYGVPRTGLAAEDAPTYTELHPEEMTTLLREVAERPSARSVGKARWEKYLVNVINELTAPVVEWRMINGNCTPQWVVAPPEAVAVTLRKHQEEQARVKGEMERITRLLPKLKKATNLAAIRQIERKRSPFTTAAASGRWRQYVHRQQQDILGQQRFREQKMEDFGFKAAEFTTAEENLWLDELIRVEKEVRPYMAYVRKAFQAALPVGSTIEFNPYRHRHDGVEFDPETIQDQDKWLRGEVMKTLRSRRNYAPITQVNVFCLDFSRSMNHELMRNLFKVVFLLVTGLEGRETYDAIHFFGSKFREAVNFTDASGYTSRKVLAKILSHVATIENGSVIYSGFGGTNISAAVENSYERIQAFGRLLEEEKPDLRFVKSILILTDGQPTVGVINIPKLGELIEEYRRGDEVSIKGIYLKHPDDKADFMARIFGPMHSVEATSFEELIASFVQTMSLTYRKQRRQYRAEQKRKRLLGQRPDLA